MPREPSAFITTTDQSPRCTGQVTAWVPVPCACACQIGMALGGRDGAVPLMSV
jgi:hypothetical protein